jgi:hypothetical protein
VEGATVVAISKSRQLCAVAAFSLAALLLANLAPSAAEDRSLRAVEGGEVRALVVGIDSYRYVRQLKGAVADAHDIEQALRHSGAQDVTALIESSCVTNSNAVHDCPPATVTRAAVMAAIHGLIARLRPRDLIVLSLAGHGAQEPERVRGTHPDGMEDVFLLSEFQNSAAGSKERIFGSEFNHLIREIELRGARVLFVADTCYGGGMTREIDPRSEAMSFRQVPSYRLTVDELKPIAASSDELLTELDFDRSAFLAAVDRQTKAPEVRIPGIPGLRGALSYAVARAIEGRADANSDGTTTLKELFTYVRQVVYQLSDQRQNIVATKPPSLDLDRSVIFEFVNPGRPIEAARPPVAAASPQAFTIDRPVRVAALDGKSTNFTQLTAREAPFEIVRPVDNPDLIWDPASGDVVAWGDVIAYAVGPSDLASVIDRTAAVRELKGMASKTPQALKVLPDDSRHRKGQIVQLEISQADDRALILFNIAGDGTVQLLYPNSADPPLLSTAEKRVPVRAQEPFGSDQLVAITSRQQMPELAQALQQLNRRRAAVQMIRMIRRYAPADARIGSVGVFTAP